MIANLPTQKYQPDEFFREVFKIHSVCARIVMDGIACWKDQMGNIYQIHPADRSITIN